MATVHLGRMVASGGFARIVAIKRLQADLVGSPEHEMTLRDEARLASRIRHPNVVAMLDMLRDGNEVFLVLEHVVGESLSRLVFGPSATEFAGPLAAPLAAGIICGVLEGLHAVHEARGDDGGLLNIVHRDISPENVMVGVDGISRLLDFGIAKGEGRSQVTRAGQLKGKVGYIPPEVILGEAASPQGDVYAAAVVLWEMLTARRLFDAGPSKDQVRLIPQVLEAKLQPPSCVAEGMPPVLDAVVMKGLRRDPGARFASAREFAVAIEGCVTPASQRSISGWVTQRAAEALAGRASQLAEFERAAERVQSEVVDRVSRSDAAAPAVSRDPTATTEGREGSIGNALRAVTNQRRERTTERRTLNVWRAIALSLAASVAYLLLR
jgi:serine/threonine-protein kinase